MEQQEIVKNFIQAYYKAQKHLDENQVDLARKQYYTLLDLYSKLNKTNIDEFQKELAYDQVTKVFSRIKESQTENRIPLNIIIAGALVIALSIVVALNPGIVGLTAFEDEISQEVNLVFDNTTVTTVILKQPPLSFAISGEFTGESAKVFLEQEGKLLLIFDSSKASMKEGRFSKACEETCKLNGFEGTTAKLFVEVKNGKLKIDDIDYHIKRIENKAPEWVGKTTEFKVTGKTELNLSSMFNDPEGDELVYLSTTDDGLDIKVENDKLIITPKEKIKEAKKITIIASDMGKLTKVPITITG
ncbi:hypothetical protein DRJ25_02375 [Candidatus Woesearchaeota archaeon]|nr:MAG: hypothetical protein DRJ25_02375 [Candidatus Woesearchaeota archaeon]